MVNIRYAKTGSVAANQIQAEVSPICKQILDSIQFVKFCFVVKIIKSLPIYITHSSVRCEGGFVHRTFTGSPVSESIVSVTCQFKNKE